LWTGGSAVGGNRNLKVIDQAKPDPLDGKIPDEVHNGTFQAVEGMTV
jgi:hypothetical protein